MLPVNGSPCCVRVAPRLIPLHAFSRLPRMFDFFARSIPIPIHVSMCQLSLPDASPRSLIPPIPRATALIGDVGIRPLGRTCSSNS